MKANPAKSILSRIDRRLKALAPPGHKKLADRAGSIRSGLSADAIRSIRRQVESGQQTNLKSTTIDKLARGLNTTSTWLLSGEGLEETQYGKAVHLASEAVLGFEESSRPMVPLVGYVGAGSKAHFYALASDDPYEQVESVEGATEKTRAMQIRGGSLGKIFDRWLVYFDDVRSPVTPDLLGKLCVVGLADGRVLIKQIARRGDRFDLYSNTEDPIEDVAIEWAAIVRDMRPM